MARWHRFIKLKGVVGQLQVTIGKRDLGKKTKEEDPDFEGVQSTMKISLNACWRIPGHWFACHYKKK